MAFTLRAVASKFRGRASLLIAVRRTKAPALSDKLCGNLREALQLAPQTRVQWNMRIEIARQPFRSIPAGRNPGVVATDSRCRTEPSA